MILDDDVELRMMRNGLSFLKRNCRRIRTSSQPHFEIWSKYDDVELWIMRIYLSFLKRNCRRIRAGSQPRFERNGFNGFWGRFHALLIFICLLFSCICRFFIKILLFISGSTAVSIFVDIGWLLRPILDPPLSFGKWSKNIYCPDFPRFETDPEKILCIEPGH